MDKVYILTLLPKSPSGIRLGIFKEINGAIDHLKKGVYSNKVTPQLEQKINIELENTHVFESDFISIEREWLK